MSLTEINSFSASLTTIQEDSRVKSVIEALAQAHGALGREGSPIFNHIVQRHPGDRRNPDGYIYVKVVCSFRFPIGK